MRTTVKNGFYRRKKRYKGIKERIYFFLQGVWHENWNLSFCSFSTKQAVSKLYKEKKMRLEAERKLKEHEQQFPSPPTKRLKKVEDTTDRQHISQSRLLWITERKPRNQLLWFFSSARLLKSSVSGTKARQQAATSDFSALSRFLVVPHFQIEMDSSIRESLQQGKWTTSIDLLDAYIINHRKIKKRYQKYFHFHYHRVVYQYLAMPLGWPVHLWISPKLGNNSKQ